MPETPHCDWHDVQGLVLRGYNQLPVGECLILTFADHESGVAGSESARFCDRGIDAVRDFHDLKVVFRFRRANGKLFWLNRDWDNEQNNDRDYCAS